MKFRTTIFVLLLAGSGLAQVNTAAKTAAAPTPPDAGARKLTILKPLIKSLDNATNAHIAALDAAGLQPAAIQPAPEMQPGGSLGAWKSRTLSLRGKRDPFVSVINTDSGPSSCASGRQCLAVGQIVLRGIVRTPSGAIAVVENGQRRAYFLRENDPVFNATLVRITGDSVVFREKVVDRVGHVGVREVVKRLAKPS